MTILTKFVVFSCVFFCGLVFAQDNRNLSGYAIGDDKAQNYRMYYDSAAKDQAYRKLLVRKFNGQIRLAHIGKIFGGLANLHEDYYGNRVSGWQMHEDSLWHITVSPSMQAVNLVSVSMDGTISSVFDLDGDQTADIVDTSLSDGRRYSIVTEDLGKEIFESWLLGQDPLCHERELPNPLPIFGCPGQTGDLGSSAGGIGGNNGPGTYDEWDALCGDHGGRGNGGYRPPVMAQGDLGDESDRIFYRDPIIYKDKITGRVVKILSSYDPDTNRITHSFSRDPGEITNEQENANESNNSSESEGDESGEHEDADHSEDSLGSSEDTPPSDPPLSSGLSQPNPGPIDGPGDPAGDMAEWCANNQPYESGVERAAATDHSAFAVDCDDFVKQGGGAGDCLIIESAKPDDFRAILDAPSADDPCADDAEPNRDCDPTDPKLPRVKGKAALVFSVDLELDSIFDGDCPPILCNPDF